MRRHSGVGLHATACSQLLLLLLLLLLRGDAKTCCCCCCCCRISSSSNTWCSSSSCCCMGITAAALLLRRCRCIISQVLLLGRAKRRGPHRGRGPPGGPFLHQDGAPECVQRLQMLLLLWCLLL